MKFSSSMYQTTCLVCFLCYLVPNLNFYSHYLRKVIIIPVSQERKVMLREDTWLGHEHPASKWSQNLCQVQLPPSLKKMALNLRKIVSLKEKETYGNS